MEQAGDTSRAALDVALRHGLPYTGLRGFEPDLRLFHYIPLTVAVQHRVLPLLIVGDTLKVASAAPDPDLSLLRDRLSVLGGGYRHRTWPRTRSGPRARPENELTHMSSAATDSGHDFYRRVARHAGLDFVDLDEVTINPLAARAAQRAARPRVLRCCRSPTPTAW